MAHTVHVQYIVQQQYQCAAKINILNVLLTHFSSAVSTLPLSSSLRSPDSGTPREQVTPVNHTIFHVSREQCAFTHSIQHITHNMV